MENTPNTFRKGEIIMDENVRANEVEETETETEVVETSDSNAGALLAGFVGGIIAYAAISGAKKLRGIIEEKWAAKKLAEANVKPVEVLTPEDIEAPEKSDGEDETEA